MQRCLFAISVFLAATPAVLSRPDMPLPPVALQTIIRNASSDPKYTYPTSLTRDIFPKAFHSHNDYWRQVPFYSALSVGSISIEADVWLDNGRLLVGHEQSALTTRRTLDSLYIQPILSVLKAQNPNNSSSLVGGAGKNGVYDSSPSQTLYLFVDIKSAGATTFPVVVDALQPLRDAGYLSTFSRGAVTMGPITVIGTGNTPLHLVQDVEPRDYFWDAPIPALSTSLSNITSGVSPIASTSFSKQFPNLRTSHCWDTLQLALLQGQVAAAHARGIKVRYWDQPDWPVGTRNTIWRTLWDNGVDLLNVDDLEGAAGFWHS